MTVSIHPTSVVEQGARLGDGVDVGPLCHIGPKVTIGDGTRLVSHVSVINRTTIGKNNIVWPHAVLGADPQDLKFIGEDTELVIGDNNTFREHVTAHIGTTKGGGFTRIGNDNLFMVASHIAHDCNLGNHIMLANAVLLAGHVNIADHAVISGGTALHHFVSVGQYAFLGGLTRVVHDCPPFMIVEGNPSSVRGINKVGLERHRFDEVQIANLREAYRTLFKNDDVVMSEALDTVEARFPDDECVAMVIDFVRKMSSGIHGRYLESLREDKKQTKPVK